MDKLFTLLELQHKAQKAQSYAALTHVIVNETIKLISYTQAVFFTPDLLSIKLERASGNAVIDTQGSYAADIKKSISSEMKNESACFVATARGGIIFFHNDHEGFLGGLWLENTQAYNEAERRILEELSMIFAQSLALWQHREKNRFFLNFKKSKKWRKYVVGTAVLAALFPVRLSISAPAEIVAREAKIITAPFDGMIEKILVEPGDQVKAEDLLVKMESQPLQAQMDVAEQEILIAQSALSRMERESLTVPDKKMNLVQLQQEIESKKISHDYARHMKERSEIRSTEAGIAVFSASQPLEGKPVHIGEKIMTITDPAKYELLVRVPVGSLIRFDKESEFSFFINLSPLKSYTAKIHSVGYQSSVDPDGLITYKILADITDKTREMRIGWKGTAHIKGEWTVLSYAIMRRPLMNLRNLIGL